MRRAWHPTEDADGDREVRPPHAAQDVRHRRVVGRLVVHEEVGDRGAASSDRHDLRAHAVEADPLVALLAEDHRLAVLQDEHPILFHRLVGEVAPCAIVEDVAVLQHLHECRSPVLARAMQHLLQVLGVRVDRSSDEARLGGGDEVDGDDRRLDRAERRRLRLLADRRGRRCLALGQAVDAVVEHDHLEVDVAAHRMDQVVAADREGVAVPRDHPDHEVGACRLEPRRDRGGAAVDRVEAEGVHVVREAPRAADPRDEDDLLLGDAEVRHRLLRLREDRVVAAAGAPAHVLIGLEVLLRQHGKLALRHFDPSTLSPSSDSAFASISPIWNGLPRTRLNPTASTRYLERTSIRSWPRLSSGINTRS